MRKPAHQQNRYDPSYQGPKSSIRSFLICHMNYYPIFQRTRIHIHYFKARKYLCQKKCTDIGEINDSRVPEVRKSLGGGDDNAKDPKSMPRLRKDREDLNRRLEMMGVRKSKRSSEIREIKNKITNLNSMHRIVLDRITDLEHDEAQIE